VDHYLCTIRKVAKLRLPQHECPGRCHGIAIFKTEHAVLRQQGVVDMELRLVLIEVVQGTIRFVRFGVEDVRVPMGERAANGVLSGHANGRALEEQRAIRQQFSFRPSQLAGFEERGLSVAQQFFNLFDGLESLRYGDEGLTDFLYDIGRDGRIGRHVKVFGPCPTHLLPLFLHFLRAVWQRLLLHFVEAILQLVAKLLVHRIRQRGVKLTTLYQLACIYLARVGMAGNDVVQLRLGKLRLVSFVMAVSAIAQQIDENILLETLTVLDGQVGCERYSLGVVAVDVEYRRIHNLGDVGTVNTGTRIVVVGSKAYLVVDNKVDRAPGEVSRKTGHLHHLVDNTLTGDGSVTVNENGHGLRYISSVFVVDLATRIPEHQRIYRLQVGRVWRKLYINLFPRRREDVAGIAQVVFYVAVAHG